MGILSNFIIDSGLKSVYGDYYFLRVILVPITQLFSYGALLAALYFMTYTIVYNLSDNFLNSDTDENGVTKKNNMKALMYSFLIYWGAIVVLIYLLIILAKLIPF